MIEGPSNTSLLRRVALSALRRFQRDITIRHHWVPGARVFLNSYLHKGYWFHGKRRERETMELFRELIAPGDTVAEVGGHIGYIAAYFSALAGPGGALYVFEPGSNNLPYIRRNLAPGSIPGGAPATIIEAAAGPEEATVTLYEDSLTGQNNSVVKDFAGLIANAKNALGEAKVDAHEVPMTTLDARFRAKRLDFVKIDVEGFELGVLRGMTEITAVQKPAIMMEVQTDHQAIFDRLRQAGYVLFYPSRKKIGSADELGGRLSNIFAMHEATHAAKIAASFPQKP
jgi:FkbM family methyltransferase